MEKIKRPKVCALCSYMRDPSDGVDNKAYCKLLDICVNKASDYCSFGLPLSNKGDDIYERYRKRVDKIENEIGQSAEKGLGAS